MYNCTSTFYSLPTKLSRHFVISWMLGSCKYVFLTTRSKIAQNDLIVVAKEVFNPFPNCILAFKSLSAGTLRVRPRLVDIWFDPRLST